MIRRMLAGSAIALATFVSVAEPAVADEGYPLTRPTNEAAVQGATSPTEVEGAKTSQGTATQETGESGLASTGGDLAPLWGGLAVVLAGGSLLLITRSRRNTAA